MCVNKVSVITITASQGLQFSNFSMATGKSRKITPWVTKFKETLLAQKKLWKFNSFADYLSHN